MLILPALSGLANLITRRVTNSPLAKHGMGFLDHLGCVCKQRSESNPSSFKEAVKEERSGAEPVERRVPWFAPLDSWCISQASLS